MSYKRCCEAMDKALNEGYLEIPLTIKKGILKAMPPAIPGPLLHPRGRKHKPSFVVSHCPWCGTKFPEE